MRVNVLGYGVMGKQIAGLLYLCGFDVCIWNHHIVDETEINKTIRILKKSCNYISEGSINFFYDLNEIQNYITIESVIEDLEIKKEIYEKVKSKNSNYYFTNTSSYRADEIGLDVGVLHFFNPISLGVIEFNGKNIDYDTQLLFDKLKEIGFLLINVEMNRGYIGNYILFSEISSIFKLIEKLGYSVGEIMKMYNKLYVNRDIFLIIDLIGVDTVYKILLNINEEDPSFYISEKIKFAYETNVLGRKNRTSIRDVL